MGITRVILESHLLEEQSLPGAQAIVMVRCDLVLLNDVSAPLAIAAMESMGRHRVFNPERVVLVADHFVPASTVQAAENLKRLREWASAQGITFYEGEGIEHTLLIEKGWATPGSLIVGGDSHTCTYGALGAFGTGLGSTDIGFALASGTVWLQVPWLIKVSLQGRKGPFISGKDVALALLRILRAHGGIGSVIEVLGSGVADLNLDERMAVANMAVEAGAETALFPANGVARGEYPAGQDDEEYTAQFTLDLSQLTEPLVACPHSPDNVVPLSQTLGRKVNLVYIGNCANGTLTDLRQAAETLRGQKVSKGTRLVIVPATRSIYRQALAEGLIDIFLEAGATVAPPTCGACFGGHMGLVASGETVVATINRNFRGRMGSSGAEIYLANAWVAAASAVAGELVHPEEVR